MKVVRLASLFCLFVINVAFGLTEQTQDDLLFSRLVEMRAKKFLADVFPEVGSMNYANRYTFEQFIRKRISISQAFIEDDLLPNEWSFEVEIIGEQAALASGRDGERYINETESRMRYFYPRLVRELKNNFFRKALKWYPQGEYLIWPEHNYSFRFKEVSREMFEKAAKNLEAQEGAITALISSLLAKKIMAVYNLQLSFLQN